MLNPTIRPANENDAAELTNIYNYYIANTYITFETDEVTAQDMTQRISEADSIPLPWLVAEAAGEVLGYAYASKWKGRCAYRYAVEATIYLSERHTGHGVGTLLYPALIDAIRSCSMHSVIAGIALPNDNSIRLHERLGFKKVGHFEQVGFKHEQWVDVGYWQLAL